MTETTKAMAQTRAETQAQTLDAGADAMCEGADMVDGGEGTSENEAATAAREASTPVRAFKDKEPIVLDRAPKDGNTIGKARSHILYQYPLQEVERSHAIC